MLLKCFSIAIALIAILVYIVYFTFIAPLPPPEIDTAKYWGPSGTQAKNQVEKVDSQPFKINYSADVIAKLRNRLSEPLNLVEPLEGVNFRYGFEKKTLERLIAYWRDNYLPRWNERQTFLNELPQYTTKIQGSVISITTFIMIEPCELLMT